MFLKNIILIGIKDMSGNPIFISLKTSIVASIIVFILGIVLAKSLLKKEFKFRRLIESIIMLPLFMPPSLIGYIILIVIGRNGIIGKFIYDVFDFSFVFTWQGAVIACVITTLPIMYGSAKGAILSVEEEYKLAAMDLGANSTYTFFKITVPLASKGLLSGFILAFARCFGEFGATMMVAGNIPGKTQNVPMAIYYAVESGNTEKVKLLAIMVGIISITLIFFYNRLLNNK